MLQCYLKRRVIPFICCMLYFHGLTINESALERLYAEMHDMTAKTDPSSGRGLTPERSWKASRPERLDKEVRGLITDSSGMPLPGVTISVKSNPAVGTTTDLNGRYILEAPDNAVLVFSMIGYDKQEIPVNGREVINVRLLPSSNVLGETVVVAFGKQKKADVVGAVTTINPEELKVPASNLTTALAGRLSGVIAYQRSGEP